MTTPAERDSGRSGREALVEAAAALPNLVKLLYRLLRDNRVPRRPKLFAGVAVAYVVMPIDVIPDFIPVVGSIDDILLVATALHVLFQAAGSDVVHEHWDGEGDVVALIADIVAWGADLVPRPVRATLERLAR